MPWTYDLWFLQILGLMAAGGGAIALGISLFNRARHMRGSADVGVPGNLPPTPGINMATIRVGGDIGGLAVVIGLIVAFMPDWWPWFVAVAAGSIVMACGLFLWHRYHPW